MSSEEVIPPRIRRPSPLADGVPWLLLADANGDKTKLSLENGDLIATAIEGPNAGKSVNLTYGKWT